jgi:glutamate synthase (NADPH/NADH) small chain
MGKTNGFLLWTRETAPKREADARVGDWREFVRARDPETMRHQGGRCMDCGVPFCQQGCPLGNLIPDWNDLVYRDRWKEAWTALSSTNNFPEFTGRICPAPCEAACVLAINDKAVTIEQIEKEIAEHAFEQGWVRPVHPAVRTGRRVAIVGAGPAGLAAAAQLHAAGHSVVVFERDERPGGLLRFGIPDFKLEKRIVDRRIDVMIESGIEFRTGVHVGEHVGWDELRAQFDALLVTIGAGRPRDLDVPGRDLQGVHFAMDFLGQQNRVLSGIPVDPERRILAEGRNVVILGGGDTGSDCLGTSIRQGARSINQMELMPAPPTERTGANPWPQWPMVFSTSSSQEEGGDRVFSWQTTELVGDDRGRLRALRGHEVRAVRDGAGMRFEPVEGTARELPCELLLLAMGFLGPAAASLEAQLGCSLTARGNVQTDGTFRTTVPGVYAAGDANRGQSLVVWAISEGREAARIIDADLLAATPRLPTRGTDQPFGGR